MWLLKTEPSEYSFDDLVREGRTMWSGVRNPVALRNLRAMALGDRCFVYHTGDERAVVGLAKVVQAAYPDPTAKNERIVVVDLAAVARLRRAVSLAEMKRMVVFKDSPLVRQGRLSVVPLTASQWAAVEKAGAQ